MSATHRVLNFGAGPAALPLPALERARDELCDFQGTGRSILEHSHRGPDYERVHDQALELLRSVAAVPDSHDILLLQGGASMQFAQIPLNFLPPGGRADYVVHGAWGHKALTEARLVAQSRGATVREAHTTRDEAGRYARRPDAQGWTVDPQATYLHCTSNETVHGIQMAPGIVDPNETVASRLPPTGDVPLVCDMSSDFLWKPTDFSPFGLVYAGAQKNVGPSGLVVVIVRKDWLAAGRTDLPQILQYRAHASQRSLLNTPPTFSVYLMRNVLEWLVAEGGLPEMERRARERSEAVMAALHRSPSVYRMPVEPAARSRMNVVWTFADPRLEQEFLDASTAAGMVGLAGHRSVGGMRASLYNAIPVEWAHTLAQFIDDFGRRHG